MSYTDADAAAAAAAPELACNSVRANSAGFGETCGEACAPRGPAQRDGGIVGLRAGLCAAEGDVGARQSLSIGEVVAAWADERVFRNGHWEFDTAPDSLRTLHCVAGGRFYATGPSVTVTVTVDGVNAGCAHSACLRARYPTLPVTGRTMPVM